MSVVRTGMPTGPDLLLLRELHARRVEYLLAGRIGAAVQGVEIGWSAIDLYVFHATDALKAAQRASGHEPWTWPVPPEKEAYSPVHVASHPAEGYWSRVWRESVELTIEDVPVRALPLAGVVEALRETVWTPDFEAIETIESASERRGGEAPRPHVPETRLGMLYGPSLSAVESILCGAGYTRSSSGRARTYSVAYDDVEPHTGARSADIAYAEDPERPVTATIRHVLGRR